MKLLDFLGYYSARASHQLSKRFSRRHLYTFFAVSTFFLMITAQFFWATIHGDGAVYAWITRQISEHGIISGAPPHWTQTDIFAEHPYLFFYLSSGLTNLFGISDLVMKIPNFLVAGLSIWVVWRVACVRDGLQKKSYQIGLVAGYALILNAAYALQISQPTLDPLAQLFGYLPALILIYFNRSAFLAGFILGLAFLTKGLELLPNLAAVFFLICYLEYRNLKDLVRNVTFGLIGLAIPVAIWLGYDHFIWQGQWSQTYVMRQFQGRLLSEANMKSFFGFAYLETFIRVYFIEIIIIAVGFFKSTMKCRRKDPLFFYFLCYLFFHLLAFMIIKKDSSQHLTGVILVGSVFVGESIWEGLQKLNRSLIRFLPAFLFVIALIYWCFYTFHKNDKTDLWTSIKNESENSDLNENNLPIVVKDSTADNYGLFNTIQWYFPKHKVYLQPEADLLLIGQEVIMLSDRDGWKLVKERTTYKKGAL